LLLQSWDFGGPAKTITIGSVRALQTCLVIALVVAFVCSGTSFAASWIARSSGQ